MEDSLRRNEGRADQVPEVAILSTAKKLQLPRLDEGFDELLYVKIEDDKFVVEEWDDEI